MSAITIINKLEKQLNDEKSEREKMRNEIEELRKMNEKLCNVIVQSQNGALASGSLPNSNISH